MASTSLPCQTPTKLAIHLPEDWQDDMKMTVMFSPFREKTLNPKSWDQKLKFWSELILEESKTSGEVFIDVLKLKQKFHRKGKKPSCLQTVFQEMTSKGQIKKLSEMNLGGTEGWISWSYNRLVKKPVGWGFKWLSGQQEQDTPTETFVVLDVLKQKAEQLLEVRSRLCQTKRVHILEYSELRHQHADLCPTDLEFDLVMRQLVEMQQVVIQEGENKAKFVKFVQKVTTDKTINEQDLHIHRIQKAYDELKRKIEILSSEVQRLGNEAVAYKQKGMNKLAISCMRKRKLAQNRIDRMTGSMDTLDDILHRIQDAESNEMVLKAIEGGTSVLQGLNSKVSADDVNTVMDNLADVTQMQEDVNAELSMTGIDEPSQSELEEELSLILQDTPPRAQAPPLTDEDKELEAELQRVLDLSSDKDDSSAGLDKLLDDLQLPDVPTSSPSPVGNRGKRQQLLTS